MSDCTTWWIDHVAETYLYVVATRQKDEQTQAKSVEKLVEGSLEWGTLLGSEKAGELMGEHVAGVKVLADAAFVKDEATVNAAVDAALANAKQQSQLYDETIQGFPVHEWNKLFVTHITATGGYILALAAGDVEDFKKNYGKVIADRNALARFWGRVCTILLRK